MRRNQCSHVGNRHIGTCRACALRFVSHALGTYHPEVMPAQRMVRWHLAYSVAFVVFFLLGSHSCL